MNNMAKFLFVILVIACILFGFDRIVYATELGDGSIVIEGQVINGTDGSNDVSGITVVLHRVGTNDFHSLDAVTDQYGLFKFNDVVPYDDSFYAIAVDYMGALYVEVVDFSSNSKDLVTVTIYDSIDNDEILSVTSMEIMFSLADVDNRTIWAWEIVNISNISNTTYVPGRDPMNLLRFGLPSGSTGLYVDTDLLGSDVIQVDLGFGITASVPPGDHKVMYAYQFPYDGDSIAIEKSLTYGSNLVRVLALPDLGILSSSYLGTADLVDIGQSSYQLLSWEDQPRGSNISISIEGLPKPSVIDSAIWLLSFIKIQHIALAGMGTLMAGLIVGSFLRRRYISQSN